MKLAHIVASAVLALSASAAMAQKACSPVNPCEVPEPGSLALMIGGLVGVIAAARFFRK